MEKGFCQDLKFRHIRYVDRTGTFIKVRRKFTSFSELYAYLERQGATDAYYSVARFLNPERVGAKTREGPFDTVFLGMDLFFDIDIPDSSLHDVFVKGIPEVKKLLTFADTRGWKLTYIAFSGAKGFHLSFEDVSTYEGCYTPKEREARAVEDRKNILDDVLAEGIPVDSRVTADSRRIVRIPGTYNSKTGLLCAIISRHCIVNTPPQHLLSCIPYDPLRKREQSLLKVMSALSAFAPIITRGRLSRALPHPPPSHIVAVSSNCVRNHVLILRLLRDGKKEREILTSLGVPFVLFSLRRTLFVFSPTVFHYKELCALAHALHSPDEASLRKYHHALLPVSFHDTHFHTLQFPIRVRLIYSPPTSSRQICGSHAILFENLTKTKISSASSRFHPLVFRILQEKEH